MRRDAAERTAFRLRQVADVAHLVRQDADADAQSFDHRHSVTNQRQLEAAAEPTESLAVRVSLAPE